MRHHHNSIVYILTKSVLIICRTFIMFSHYISAERYLYCSLQECTADWRRKMKLRKTKLKIKISNRKTVKIKKSTTKNAKISLKMKSRKMTIL